MSASGQSNPLSLVAATTTARHSWFSDRKQTTLWEFDRPSRNAEHPTMCAYAIKNSSKKGQLVLDPFTGSGSTLMACEQTDRVCYCMEMDARYCDVIVKRYMESTGKKDVILIRDNNEIPYNKVAA